MDTQQLGGFGVIAAGLLDRPLDHLLFGFSDGLVVLGDVDAGRPLGFEHRFRLLSEVMSVERLRGAFLVLSSAERDWS